MSGEMRMRRYCLCKKIHVRCIHTIIINFVVFFFFFFFCCCSSIDCDVHEEWKLYLHTHTNNDIVIIAICIMYSCKQTSQASEWASERASDMHAFMCVINKIELSTDFQLQQNKNCNFTTTCDPSHPTTHVQVKTRMSLFIPPTDYYSLFIFAWLVHKHMHAHAHAQMLL